MLFAGMLLVAAEEEAGRGSAAPLGGALYATGDLLCCVRAVVQLFSPAVCCFLLSCCQIRKIASNRRRGENKDGDWWTSLRGFCGFFPPLEV